MGKSLASRLFALFMALLSYLVMPTVAVAQSFPKPTDVSAYVSWTPQYKTDGTQNVPIDPVAIPPTQTGLTNIPAPSYTNRLVTTAAQGPLGPYCTLISNGGTCAENKMRVPSLDFSHMLPDDPVRNFKQFGASHLHCFAGAGSANAASTYASLRRRAIDSKSPGTDVNGSAYWKPCWILKNPFSDGKDYALMDDYWTTYYVGGPDKMANIVPGLREVWGYNMDDQYASLIAILNAANTASGSARYSLTNGGLAFTQALYTCIGATGGNSPTLVRADGSDPWNGTCGSGQQFFVQINGNECWDGLNLWSPGGYLHVLPRIWDNLYNKWVCPYNSYAIPFVRLEIIITQNGAADRARWCLSSDYSQRTKLGLTATQLPCGTTFHTDEIFAWDDTILQQYEANCIGTLANFGLGRECGGGYFSSTQYTKGSVAGEIGANGRNPQVDLTSIDHTTQAGMMLVPPSWSGSISNMVMKP
jgi:hypothetical protein